MTGIKTRSGLKTLTDSNLPSGTAAISAANHRALVKSMIDSLRAHGDGEVIVEDMSTTTPPAPTTSLEAYVVGSGATGDWLGRDNAIAIWDDSVSPNEWFFVEPVDGQAVWNKADDTVYRWDGDVSPSAWVAQTGSLRRGTAQSTTSGTAFDFTGIPSGVDRIDVLFSEVSLSGTDHILVQIGDSGGIETSGYASYGGAATDGSVTDGVSSTSGFIIFMNVAAGVLSGRMTLERIDGDEWVANHSAKRTSATAVFGGGSKTLSATLDRVRVTRNGSNTFDAGKVNILYQ